MSKKIGVFILALLTATMLTACGDVDDVVLEKAYTKAEDTKVDSSWQQIGISNYQENESQKLTLKENQYQQWIQLVKTLGASFPGISGNIQNTEEMRKGVDAILEDVSRLAKETDSDSAEEDYSCSVMSEPCAMIELNLDDSNRNRFFEVMETLGYHNLNDAYAYVCDHVIGKEDTLCFVRNQLEFTMSKSGYVSITCSYGTMYQSSYLSESFTADVADGFTIRECFKNDIVGVQNLMSGYADASSPYQKKMILYFENNNLLQMEIHIQKLREDKPGKLFGINEQQTVINYLKKLVGEGDEVEKFVKDFEFKKDSEGEIGGRKWKITTESENSYQQNYTMIIQ